MRPGVKEAVTRKFRRLSSRAAPQKVEEKNGTHYAPRLAASEAKGQKTATPKPTRRESRATIGLIGHKELAAVLREFGEGKGGQHE